MANSCAWATFPSLEARLFVSLSLPPELSFFGIFSLGFLSPGERLRTYERRTPSQGIVQELHVTLTFYRYLAR